MSRPLFTPTFWLDALERAIKTAAQSTLAVIVAAQADGAVDAIDFDGGAWIVGLATAGSILMSIISSGIGEPGSASLLNPAPPDTLNDNPRG